MVETLETLGGELPGRTLRLGQEWATLHRAELEANWDRAEAPCPWIRDVGCRSSRARTGGSALGLPAEPPLHGRTDRREPTECNGSQVGLYARSAGVAASRRGDGNVFAVPCSDLVELDGRDLLHSPDCRASAG